MQILNPTPPPPSTSIPFYYPNEATVKENREGRLTASQIGQIQNTYNSDIQTLNILAIASLVLIPTALLSFRHILRFSDFSIFVIVPIVSLFFWGLARYKAKNLSRELNEPVTSTTGTLTISAQKPRNPFASFPVDILIHMLSPMEYSIQISKFGLTIPADEAKTLPENIECVAYYARRSMKLLSIEQIMPSTSKS